MLRYVTRINNLREIEEVIEGKRMFSLPYRDGEKESLLVCMDSTITPTGSMLTRWSSARRGAPP